ncbi:neuromedin-B isoform X2 [Sciurus carolinensis]|uniref:neuromedin-B isoform X2 n=1 Tax=Sciurus carolinensis TaxID=30640 RepID=UPI001FB32960|nr:neuromedin-B isoform X2 [Sciurus carolinensis]
MGGRAGLLSQLRPGRRFKSREGGSGELAAGADGRTRAVGTAMARHAVGARWLSGLLLFMLLAAGVAPLNWDIPESRSRTSKIRVHPRGNLWATGHFMGKKSLESPQAVPLGTTPHTSPRDQRLLQLSHDLLRILRLKKALSMSISSPAPQTQYRRLVVQILKK